MNNPSESKNQTHIHLYTHKIFDKYLDFHVLCIHSKPTSQNMEQGIRHVWLKEKRQNSKNCRR